MFRAKTCLVVGAGASCEAGFPDGRTLLGTIRTQLGFRYEMGNRLISGDSVLARALLERAGEYNDEFHSYFAAARRISDAAAMGLSIDNIIEQHDDDDTVKLCGKMAIVRSIIQAEHQSKLMPAEGHLGVDISKLAGTWYERFMQILTENVPRRNADGLFNNISIVTFNYDRSIEQYIPYALVRAYGMQLNEAKDILRGVKIIHPYGSVGSLEGNGNNNVRYGSLDGLNICDLSKNVRTFSERFEDDIELDYIRNPISEAEQVIYLGFAFHRQNMELLHNENANVKRIYATVLGVSVNDQSFIRDQISDEFNVVRHGGGITLHPNTCGTLFEDNWRGISSPII